ncbi:MAG TPA: N-acetylmuramoyl-L-alanine amidase [Negativicutes bacterium]
MRRIMFSLVLMCMLLVPHAVWAGIADADMSNADSPVKITIQKNNKTAAKSAVAQTELSAVRWATHVDAVTGAKKLRLVIDATGPVAVNNIMSDASTPGLTVTMKGVSIGKLEDDLALDGKIAQQVSFSTVDGDNSSSKLTIKLPSMIAVGDYKVFTLPSDIKAKKPFRVIVDINQPVPIIDYHFTAGLKNKVIAIDPGHGGSDSGAVGLNKTQEKTITLAVAQKMQVLLEKAGAKVLMTRKNDRDVYGPNASAVDELNARAMVGNNNKADVFVSIHINAFTSPSACGTATYYYSKSAYDMLLAQNIQNSLVSVGGLLNRGISSANFYVIKHTNMPAILAELAFISNPQEEKLLNSVQFQQQMAQGLVQGLDSFFTQAAKQGGGV